MDVNSVPRFLPGLFALIFPPTWNILSPHMCPDHSCSLYSVLMKVFRMGFLEVVVHEK